MTSTAPESPPWLLCRGCRAIVYGRRWRRSLGTCPECGQHDRLTARQRVESLLDEGSSRRLVPRRLGQDQEQEQDPLGFTDTLPYPERLAEARQRTGLDEAVICVRGTIEDHPLVMAVMDFGFMGGSLGAVAGDRITLAAEAAIAERLPLMVVTASGGARMQEGAIALMQMAKTSAAFAMLDEAGLLSICLITDPTFGGVAASFATLADVIIAEPGARLGFAGRRVIEQTIQHRLPDGFQTAEFLFDRGFIDRVIQRPALRTEISMLLRSTVPRGVRAAARANDPGTTVPQLKPNRLIRDPALLPERDAWRQVLAARQIDRPTTTDYLALVFEDFQELHGDRAGGDCAAMVCGLARLAGQPVAVVGLQKGHDAAELAKRHYGMASPAGYRKASRIMRLAAKLRLPVITLVDTPGASPTADAEEQGQAVAIAENIRLMMSLPVPVISVITGEGGSGGALGIAAANRVLILANAVYSVITAEGCAAILWRDPDAAPHAAARLGLTPGDLLRAGVVDGVVPEPEAGAGSDVRGMAQILRDVLIRELSRTSGPPETLVAQRRARYRGFGSLPELADGPRWEVRS